MSTTALNASLNTAVHTAKSTNSMYSSSLLSPSTLHFSFSDHVIPFTSIWNTHLISLFLCRLCVCVCLFVPLSFLTIFRHHQHDLFTSSSPSTIHHDHFHNHSSSMSLALLSHSMLFIKPLSSSHVIISHYSHDYSFSFINHQLFIKLHH